MMGRCPWSGDVAKKEPQAVYARLGFFELCLNLRLLLAGQRGVRGIGVPLSLVQLIDTLVAPTWLCLS